ncbi:GxxExxY protein [Verrucomicrobia bacterium S94]|nr:GxxExxY protein [Verrucomicrobia bacterium S94]
MTENEIGTIVVKCSIQVHQALGPGLLESVYQKILAHELVLQGLDVQTEVGIPINYNGIEFDEGFRADIVVNNKIILELKSLEMITPVHMRQLQTYLRLTGMRLGYLLNFGDVLMKDGIRRAVNGLEE